jgi:hypothetical protein
MAYFLILFNDHFLLFLKKTNNLKTVYILISDVFFSLQKCHKIYGMPFGSVTNILLAQKKNSGQPALIYLIL